MLERSPWVSQGVRRVPSFRNFELPQLSFTRFPNNLGRSWSLNGSYQGTIRERRENDDIEQQELRALSDCQETDETNVKSEPDQSDEAEDPNLVSYSATAQQSLLLLAD